MASSKKEFVIIVLCLILITGLNILLVQFKGDIIQKFIVQNKPLNGEPSFIKVTENLREYYLKEYLLQKFYEKYSEDELLKKALNGDIKVWTLGIDEINLLAEIEEGTEVDILNKYIGHFEETNIFEGNVGLAAHNRGYPVNYFRDLDKLEIGEDIYYRIDDYVKKYKVHSIQIIEDTDWSYLEKGTKDDIITLITCVKNEPNYRLCVQAYKESEEILNNAEKNFNSRYGNNFIIKCDIFRNC